MVPDTWATHHFSPNLNNFNQVEPNRGSESVYLGDVTDASSQLIHYLGTGIIKSSNSNSKSFILKNLLHAHRSLQFPSHCFSFHKFSLDNNYYFIFHPFNFVVKDKRSLTLRISKESMILLKKKGIRMMEVIIYILIFT